MWIMRGNTRRNLIQSDMQEKLLWAVWSIICSMIPSFGDFMLFPVLTVFNKPAVNTSVQKWYYFLRIDSQTCNCWVKNVNILQFLIHTIKKPFGKCNAVLKLARDLGPPQIQLPLWKQLVDFKKSVKLVVRASSMFLAHTPNGCDSKYSPPTGVGPGGVDQWSVKMQKLKIKHLKIFMTI